MQSHSLHTEAIAIAENETYQVLLARAQRRTGGVPPDGIVRHVLSVTDGGDWPVQRDALDAVLRRCASAHADEIQIVERPRGGLGSVCNPASSVARTPVPHAAPSDRTARRQLRVRRLPPELAWLVQAPLRRPVSEPGIESRIADLVGSKKAFFTGLFDGTTDEVAFERSGGFLSRIERLVAPVIPPTPVGVEDAGVSEDDGAERDIEAVMGASDDSADVVDGAAAGAEPMPSAANIQRLVSGLTVQRTAGGLVLEGSPEVASTLAALFSGMAQLLQSAATPQVVGGRPVRRLQRK